LAFKSILDIDVQTQNWEKFQQQFDLYSERLRKQPELWKKISADHEKFAKGFAHIGDSTEEHLSALQDMKDVGEEQEKTLSHSKELWGGIAGASASTAKNVIHATTSLLKWGGIFTGISGLLGYFTLHGMSDLGANVYGWRKSAAGLGVSIGQQRAFNISFGRLLGSPEGFLGGINAAVSNVAAQGPLYALGVNPNGSTGSVALATLQALRGITQRTPTNQLGIVEQMYQLGNLGISVEDLRRLQSMTPAEFKGLLGTYHREQGALNIGDRTALAWTNFVTTMDLAKSKIENVFVNGLVPLTGPLEKLAGGFTHLLQVVMQKNGPIEQGINAIASWMDSFNGKITSKPFIQQFMADVQLLGLGIHELAEDLNAWEHPLQSAWDLTRWGKAGIVLTTHNPGNLKFAGQAGAILGPKGFAQFPNDEAGLFAMGRQLELYNSRGINTVQGIVSTYAPASDRNDVPAYIADVDKYLGVTSTERLDLSNPRVLTALMRAMILHEQGYSPDRGSTVANAAKDVLARTGIIVTVENKIGSDVSASVSAQGASR